MAEARRPTVGRDDSPADVQMARSFVAVVAGLVMAGCLGGQGAMALHTGRLPGEIRTVATVLAVTNAILWSGN